MSQTSYASQAPIGFPGMEANLKQSYNVSRVNQEAVAIPFGIALANGSADTKVKLPAAATDVIEGVALGTFWANNQALANSDGVAAGGALNVMKNGSICVKVEEAVSKGDPVFIRFADSGDGLRTQKGAFRKDVDGGTARRLRGAYYASGALAAGIAVVLLDGALDDHDEVVLVMDHAQNANAGDVIVNAFKVPADRFFVIDEVDYVNPTGLAADDTNWGVLSVKHGTTTAASWSTKTTGGNGDLVANTTVALVNAALASRVVPPGTQVFLSVADNGAATIPAGRVAIKGHFI